MSRVNKLRERFDKAWPTNWAEIVHQESGLSLAGAYGKRPISNVFGKGSGQLSLNLDQIRADAEAGLGFVVLKTLIGEGPDGTKTMGAWSEPASRMKVERISATRTDAPYQDGWTVSWRGRGWSGTLQEYLDLFRDALRASTTMLVVPSAKCSLPSVHDAGWHQEEYDYTIGALLEAWQAERDGAMPIEKDFSPTLAGDESYSDATTRILEWVTEAPKRIRNAANGRPIEIGVKLFNTRFSDDFQAKAIESIENTPDADYLIYGNRLFDSEREFLGEKGAAYGGPDLLGRNLSVLAQTDIRKPLSATGGIGSGLDALRYINCGADSLQLHTFFQLPNSEYTTAHGSRTERALQTLLFHPQNGLLLIHERCMEAAGEPIPSLAALSKFALANLTG